MAPRSTSDSLLFVLDSGAISHGANLPPAQCRAPASVLAEFQPGGATRRRLDLLLAAGLIVQDPSAPALARVDATAKAAGNAGRLSVADRDVVALALELGPKARLVTDDYTVQDVAKRLGIVVDSIATKGTERAMDWTARCSGCGRTYGADLAGKECGICGAEIRAKPKRR